MIIVEIFGSLGKSEEIIRKIREFLNKNKIHDLSLSNFKEPVPIDETGEPHILVKVLTDDQNFIKIIPEFKIILKTLDCRPKIVYGRQIREKTKNRFNLSLIRKKSQE